MTTNPSKQLWQQALSDVITDPLELLTLLELDLDLLEDAKRAACTFPLRVTRSFVSRMQKKNPHDPLLKQVLPLGVECEDQTGYVRDPLRECEINPVSGLLHRYHGRVLVTLTGVCAIHCRYCFRRHFPYAENNPGRQGWRAIFEYLRANETIEEVILSGGDPLCVNDALLQSFSEQLDEVAQVKRLRLHTRLPIVLPERMTDGLLTWIKQLKQQCVIVIHANHAKEIDETVHFALQRLKTTGATLFNQSVLLKGVNDTADCLTQLSHALFNAGVLPYYLHVLDKVKGSAHFDIPNETAITLHREMSHHLPGYLVPKLVREVPGAKAKKWL